MTEAGRSAAVDLVQSSQYRFPYHYLPSPEGFPFFARHWGFSASYLAAIRLAKGWLDALPPGAPHRHMDFGCGDGGFLNALTRLMGASAVRFEGVDSNEQAIRWAKLFAIDPDCFRADDIANLPEAAYDTGTLIEVLEHIPPDEGERFLRLVARALKPSALLFLTVPSTEKPLERKHYRHFDFDTLRTCIAGTFDVVEQFGFERRTAIHKLFVKLTLNGFVYLETRPTSRYLVRQYAAKHRALRGCGRIGMVLRRR